MVNIDIVVEGHSIGMYVCEQNFKALKMDNNVMKETCESDYELVNISI
jgi:hypothetical protein